MRIFPSCVNNLPLFIVLNMLPFSSVLAGSSCPTSCPKEISNSKQLNDVINDKACEGKTITLRNGVYTPIISTSGDPKDKTFNVTVKNITLKGSGKTIISGDLGIQADNTDNARHVMTVLDTGSGLTLNNLTVANGYTDLVNQDDGLSAIGQGAGLYVENAKLVLNKVIIRNNTIFETTPPSPNDNLFSGGAGLFARGSQVVIKNSLITNNQATNAAGFAVVGKTFKTSLKNGNANDVLTNKGNNGSLIIEDSIIDSNKAINASGGGQALGLDNLAVRRSYFKKNEAPAGFGGGMVIFNTIQSEVKNSKFILNKAARYGGLLNEVNRVATVTTTAAFTNVIKNCLFVKNIIKSTDDVVAFAGGLGTNVGGGGTAATQRSNIFYVTVSDSLFIGNDGNIQGGGWNLQNVTARINNLKFINNKATYGGAMLVGYTSVVPEMNNVQFIDNFAPNDPDYGLADAGALDVVFGSSIVKMNHIDFIRNKTEASGGAILLGFDDPSVPPSSIGQIKNSKFINNTAADVGNAIFCENNNDVGPFINTLLGPNQDISGCNVKQ